MSACPTHCFSHEPDREPFTKAGKPSRVPSTRGLRVQLWGGLEPRTVFVPSKRTSCDLGAAVKASRVVRWTHVWGTLRCLSHLPCNDLDPGRSSRYSKRTFSAGR